MPSSVAADPPFPPFLLLSFLPCETIPSKLLMALVLFLLLSILGLSWIYAKGSYLPALSVSPSPLPDLYADPEYLTMWPSAGAASLVFLARRFAAIPYAWSAPF